MICYPHRNYSKDDNELNWIDNIRNGVDNVSSIPFSRATINAGGGGNISYLGKRPLEMAYQNNDHRFGRAQFSINDANETNPVQTAWMIHQVTGTDDSTGYAVEEDGGYDDQNIPLHIACGYVDDMLGSYTDFFEAEDLTKQNLIALPELDNFGAWPYTEPIPKQPPMIPTSAPPQYLQTTELTYENNDSLSLPYSTNTRDPLPMAVPAQPLPVSTTVQTLYNSNNYCQPTSRQLEMDALAMNPFRETDEVEKYFGGEFNLLAMSNMKKFRT